MTDNRVLSMSEDEFDAQLGRYLRWESGQMRAAPDAEEIAQRIAGRGTPHGPAQRHWAGSPAVAWAALVLALLIVAAALFVAGNQNPNLVVVPPGPSSQLPSSLPTTAPSSAPARTPITGGGPCREGRISIELPTGFVELPRDAESIQKPPEGLLAMALEADSTSGVIVMVDQGPTLVRTLATFSGEEVDWDGRVQVLSWAFGGDALLVLTLSSSRTDADGSCGSLFVVPTDGRAVQQLTDYGPGVTPYAANFSPSGRAVAYTLGTVLHVVTLAGGSQEIPIGCPWIVGELRWTPDERRILVQCELSIVIVDLAAEQGRSVPVGPLDARWSSDAQRIVVAVGDEEPGLVGGPLSIVDVNPADLTFTTRVRSDVSTEWVVGVPSLSPDNRWLLVEGDGNVLDIPYYPTYLVSTGSGRTVKLPWPVMADSIYDPQRRLPRVTWLSGNDRVMTVQDGTLYEVGLRAITRTAVGAVPALDYAWFPTQ